MRTNDISRAPELTGVQYETKKQTAMRLQVSVRGLENWIRRGMVPAIRVGRRVLIDPAALDRALAERTVNAGR